MVLKQAIDDIAALLNKAGVHAKTSDIVFPPNPTLGDLSFPLFATAKDRGIAPGVLAQKLSTTIQPQGLIEKIGATGPYLNFFLKRGEVTKGIITPPTPPLTLRGGKYKKVLPLRLRGSERGLRDQKIMLEMISPNNNKPLHLGHLRNAFLGESVSRLLESQGAKVIRACFFNDRGLHIAKVMLGYKLWAGGKTPTSERMKPDQFVVQWYVLFEHKAKQDPTLSKQAEELVRQWETGDKATLAFWKKIAGWALEGINNTLARLNLKFNVIYFESKLWKQGKKIVAEGLKKDLFKKDKTGAIIVEFANLPPKVLLRADGTAIYATADLHLTSEKFKKYKLDRAIWCVGQEQNLYLQQLFAIMKILGYKWENKCEHLSYGLVHLPEGRMKTREGTVVEADPLLDHMVELAEKEIRERHIHLSEKEIEDRAEIVAQAALRYYLLKVGPKNSVNFDPQASISFTGDTGPYLLYTYARIASIIRKSGNPSSPPLKIRGGTGGVMTNTEWQVVFALARFSEIIKQSATNRDPSHLAKYLYDLAQQFSNFYEQLPVLKAEEPIRSFRLALISKLQTTLKQGLQLLTIKTVEEM